MRCLDLSWRLGLFLAVLAALVPRAAADALQEARELRRQLRYDDARSRVEIVLPDLEGDARAQALLLLATLVTEPKDVRRCLSDAARAATTPDLRRQAVLEQAKLDYARGNYRLAQTRLESEPSDAESAHWLELCVSAQTAATAPRAALAPPPASTAQLSIQLGAFEDRSNALRFRAGLPADLQPVTLQEVESARGTMYRVLVGVFDSREAAEAWASSHVASRGYAWQVVRRTEGGAP
jgi:cell division protein FtsN